MTSPTFTFKIQSLYCAYALNFDVCSFGGCFEEALNTLHDELRAQQINQRSKTGEEGNAANGES